MPIPINAQGARSCVHGVVDSLYPNQLARTQISRAINFDLGVDGQLESRGGSQLSTALSYFSSAVGTDVTMIAELAARETTGAITYTPLIKVGDSLFKGLGTATTTVQNTLSTNKPSIVNFINSTGGEIVAYADGVNFAMYDGTTWTDLLPFYQAGVGIGCPRYLWVLHNVLWASGDGNIPDIVAFCDPLSPNTNWGSNSWIRIDGGFDKITGLNQIYDYLFIGSTTGCHIIKGSTSADFEPVQVATNVGVSSHWSIETVEAKIFFANEQGIYVGTLRAAEQDGLDTDSISGNMSRTYESIVAGWHSSIQALYNENEKEIYFTLQTGASSTPDKMLVFGMSRSIFNAPLDARASYDTRYVWAGYHEGLTYESIGVLHDANNIIRMYAGGSAQQVHLLYTGFKDARPIGLDTGTDIAYEINTAEVDLTRRRKVRYFYPVLYQKYNGAWKYQALMNRRVIKPETALSVLFSGNIPYWNENNPEQSTVWGGSIWDERPTLEDTLGVGTKCNTIMYILTCDGSNELEEVSFVSYSQDIQ